MRLMGQHDHGRRKRPWQAGGTLAVLALAAVATGWAGPTARCGIAGIAGIAGTTGAGGLAGTTAAPEPAFRPGGRPMRTSELEVHEAGTGRAPSPSATARGETGGPHGAGAGAGQPAGAWAAMKAQRVRSAGEQRTYCIRGASPSPASAAATGGTAPCPDTLPGRLRTVERKGVHRRPDAVAGSGDHA